MEMRIFFENVNLRIQKQNVPTISQTKVQTFLNVQDTDHRYVFINRLGETYPEKTDRHCWWCRHSFETAPLGIPIRKLVEDNHTCYDMEGVFCSFECQYAFLCDNSQGSNLFSYRYSKSLLVELYRLLGHEGELKQAPDWKLLETVGTGNLTIKQFRSNLAVFYRIPTIIPLCHVSKYMIVKK